MALTVGLPQAGITALLIRMQVRSDTSRMPPRLLWPATRRFDAVDSHWAASTSSPSKCCWLVEARTNLDGKADYRWYQLGAS